MQKAKVVTKASDWFMEGLGDEAVAAKYVGLKLDGSWVDIFSLANNVMCKFVLQKTNGFVEFYLANKPPFIRLAVMKLSDSSKWEVLVGELKHQLKAEKLAEQHHVGKINSSFSKIKPHLK